MSFRQQKASGAPCPRVPFASFDMREKVRLAAERHGVVREAYAPVILPVRPVLPSKVSAHISAIVFAGHRQVFGLVDSGHKKYPAPLVDHATQRQAALAFFKEI